MLTAWKMSSIKKKKKKRMVVKEISTIGGQVKCLENAMELAQRVE